MKRIKIFDTTLRDGEQSPGCSMNLNEKIEMARQLEKLGVDVIEAGFAIASPMDFKSVQTIASVVENATVASLARCTKGDIDAAWDAVKEARHPRPLQVRGHRVLRRGRVPLRPRLPRPVLLQRHRGGCDDAERPRYRRLLHAAGDGGADRLFA